MQYSPSLAKIAPALVAAQAELEHVEKTKQNTHLKNMYADLPDVIDAVKPVYEKHGLTIVQGGIPDDAPVVVVQTMILHTSGEFIMDDGLRLPLGRMETAQGAGACVTYGRRYMLGAMTGLAPDDDDDGNAASGVTSKPTQTRSKPSPAVKATPAPKSEKVTAEQAEELKAAAIAAGVDESVAAAKARLTDADKFVEKLTYFKNKAKGAN